MKASIEHKLDSLNERFDEITALLSQPDVQGNQNKFRSLSQEYAQINPIVDCYKKFLQCAEDLQAAQEMAKDADPELRDMAKEETFELEKQQEVIEHKLQVLLLPKEYGRAPAATKRHYFPAISPACTSGLLKKEAGKPKSSAKVKASMAAIKKSFCAFPARMFIRN